MKEIFLFIKFFNEAWPMIKSIFDIWKMSPDEERQKMISTVHAAVKKGTETGDTTDEESIIRNGRPTSRNS